MNSINVCILWYVTLVLFYADSAFGVEWDCASTTNTGTYTRSKDCTTISGNSHVAVKNTLEITVKNTAEITVAVTVAITVKHYGRQLQWKITCVRSLAAGR